jgi:hypothetical protein
MLRMTERPPCSCGHGYMDHNYRNGSRFHECEARGCRCALYDPERSDAGNADH